MNTVITIAAMIAIVAAHILMIVEMHRHHGEARSEAEKPCRNEAVQCC